MQSIFMQSIYTTGLMLAATTVGAIGIVVIGLLLAMMAGMI